MPTFSRGPPRWRLIDGNPPGSAMHQGLDESTLSATIANVEITCVREAVFVDGQRAIPIDLIERRRR